MEDSMSAVAFDMSIILVLSLVIYFKDKKVRHRFIFLLGAVCAAVEIGAFLFANLMPLESGAAYPVHAFMTFLWLGALLGVRILTLIGLMLLFAAHRDKPWAKVLLGILIVGYMACMALYLFMFVAMIYAVNQSG